MLLDKGILVITGNGKGKTTIALGTALRFLGEGKRVQMVQFLKGSGFSGELSVGNYFSDKFVINQFGGSCPFSAAIRDGVMKCQKCGDCFRESKNPVNNWADKAIQAAFAALEQGYDLIVLDEVAHALKNNLLSLQKLEDFLLAAKDVALIVLTGRNMLESIIQMSDAAVECFPTKHPMEKGIAARWGIEY